VTALVLFALGLFVPLIFVGPLVGAITRRVVFKRPAPPTAEPRESMVVTRAFKPLDLGPDLVKWPSEAPRATIHFPEPPWPSELWNDAHFGRKRAAAVPPPPVEPARPKPPRKVAAAPEPAEEAFFEARTPEGLAGLSDAQVRALVEREGLVRAVEILVDRAGIDAGSVARELRRILADARARRR
jgi:hypothetical protein